MLIDFAEGSTSASAMELMEEDHFSSIFFTITTTCSPGPSELIIASLDAIALYFLHPASY